METDKEALVRNMQVVMEAWDRGYEAGKKDACEAVERVWPESFYVRISLGAVLRAIKGE